MAGPAGASVRSEDEGLGAGRQQRIRLLQGRRDVCQRAEERVAECQLRAAVLAVVNVAVAALDVRVKAGQARADRRHDEQDGQQSPHSSASGAAASAAAAYAATTTTNRPAATRQLSLHR